MSPEASALARELVALLSRPEPEPPRSTIEPGDIVQIHPNTCSVFAGLCMRVTRRKGNAVEGYILLPHRNGCKEAWYSFSEPEVTLVGSLLHAEGAYGFAQHGRFKGEGEGYEPPPKSKHQPIGHCHKEQHPLNICDNCRSR